MDMTPQELIKSLTASIGEVTKAQIHTALIPVHAEIRELKQGQQELKQGQERLERRLEHVEQKLDKVAQDHEERIERLEDHTGIHKN
jgi:chromosome segregation ATPase